MKNELKPCPFCGGTAGTPLYGHGIPDCPKCCEIYGCNHCDVWTDTANEWNTRVDERKAAVDEFISQVWGRELDVIFALKKALGDPAAVYINPLRKAIEEIYAEMFDPDPSDRGSS